MVPTWSLKSPPRNSFSVCGMSFTTSYNYSQKSFLTSLSKPVCAPYAHLHPCLGSHPLVSWTQATLIYLFLRIFTNSIDFPLKVPMSQDPIRNLESPLVPLPPLTPAPALNYHQTPKPLMQITKIWKAGQELKSNSVWTRTIAKIKKARDKGR